MAYFTSIICLSRQYYFFQYRHCTHRISVLPFVPSSISILSIAIYNQDRLDDTVIDGQLLQNTRSQICETELPSQKLETTDFEEEHLSLRKINRSSTQLHPRLPTDPNFRKPRACGSCHDHHSEPLATDLFRGTTFLPVETVFHDRTYQGKEMM